MQDLKDVTNNVHYENYRSRKLAAVTYNGVDNNKNKGQLTKSVYIDSSRNGIIYLVKIILFHCHQICLGYSIENWNSVLYGLP